MTDPSLAQLRTRFSEQEKEVHLLQQKLSEAKASNNPELVKQLKTTLAGAKDTLRQHQKDLLPKELAYYQPKMSQIEETQILIFLKGIYNHNLTTDQRDKMQAQLINWEKEAKSEGKKATQTSSPKSEKPSINSHLEQLKKFEKQEVLDIVGADLKNYQRYRDDDKGVLAVFVASKESGRLEVKEAAKFLKTEAAKKDADEAVLKKLLLRLNALLKVRGESKPECKICLVSRAGKKSISTKRRKGKSTTFDECMALLSELPKKDQKQAVHAFAEEAGIPLETASKDKGTPRAKASKEKRKAAAPGSKKYSEQIASDFSKGLKRIVKAKSKDDPIGAYKGFCKLNEESELVAKAGGVVLIKAGLAEVKTYAKGIVDKDFIKVFEQQLQEIFDYAEEVKKKAELAAKDKK